MKSKCNEWLSFIGIIIGCWILGTFYGLIPLLGWHGPYTNNCGFTLVMDYNFLAFLYFSTIVGPCIFMGFFYGRIYFVVLHHVSKFLAFLFLSNRFKLSSSQFSSMFGKLVCHECNLIESTNPRRAPWSRPFYLKPQQPDYTGREAVQKVIPPVMKFPSKARPIFIT